MDRRAAWSARRMVWRPASRCAPTSPAAAIHFTHPGAQSRCAGGLDCWRGIESAIGGAWTAKLEYLYIDLGKEEANIFVRVLGFLCSRARRRSISRDFRNYPREGEIVVFGCAVAYKIEGGVCQISSRETLYPGHKLED
jgi:hypothetical protein